MGLDKFGRYLDTKNSSISAEPGVSKKYIEDCLTEINDQRAKQTESILAYQDQMINIQKEQIIKLINDLEARIIKVINNLDARIIDNQLKNRNQYNIGY